MRNVPFVFLISPWRRAVAFTILYVLGIAPACVGVIGLGWRLVPDLFSSLLYAALINYLAVYFLARLFIRMALRDSAAANRALGQADYQGALAHLERHIALLERNPWMNRARTFLFLDVSRVGMMETALHQCGFCYASLGQMDKAVAYYERCLAINPANPMALSNLNTLNLFLGGPIRPQYDILLRYAYDHGRRGMRRQLISVFALGIGAVVVCPLTFVIVLFQSQTPFVFLPTMVLLLFVAAGIRIGYQWLAPHLFLQQMLEGIARVKRGEYTGAIDAFERQFNELSLTPFIDSWRLVLLFETSAYSYREWMLLYQLTPWVQLGRADQVVAIYEECLRLNPENVYARAGYDQVRSLQAAAKMGSTKDAAPEQAATAGNGA